MRDILSCPNCNGEMSWLGNDIFCGCGYYLQWSDKFFIIKNKPHKKDNYAEFYTKSYFQSSLYDYTSYRLGKIVGLSTPHPGSRILDLGCGPGEIAIRCAKQGAEVFGVDVSTDALWLSSERALKEGVKLNLLEFDGKKLPFKDSVFDSIILSDVVEHVDDITLESLIRDCSKTLKPDGRLIIHTAPTKNIIALSKFLKKISFNRLDFYSRMVNPDYEFLHIRYHSMESLKKFAERSSLYPIAWGEFQYLRGSLACKLLDRNILRDIFSDQLWCIAFKQPIACEYNEMAYINFLDVPSEMNLGGSADVYINHGFYDAELDKFRWTGQTASLFIKVPENPQELYIELMSSHPDIAAKPVRVSIYLGGQHVSELTLSDRELHAYSFIIPKRVGNGVKIFEIRVNRTFVPKDHGINDDPRELGIAIFKLRIS